MAGKGGARPGAGRKKGQRSLKKTKRQIAVEEASKVAAEVLTAKGKTPYAGDAHAFMVLVYKDPDQPMAVRLDAAKSAAPYEKPRLQTIAHQGGGAEAPPIRLEGLNASQLEQALTRIEAALAALEGGNKGGD